MRLWGLEVPWEGSGLPLGGQENTAFGKES